MFNYKHLLSILLMGTIFSSCEQSTNDQSNDKAVQTPKMKMTTQIPSGIESPNTIITETLGELSFFDGVPKPKTADKVYDYLDLVNAVDAYTKGIHIASMEAMKRGILEYGPANQTVLIFEELMDSKSFFLTANTTSVYMCSWLELGDEPMVIETPPDVLGIIDDHYFKYVADFGRLGPDKSKGGKFLILPPGYKGDVPKGYFVKQAETYGHWVIWRGFQKNGDPQPAVQATKKTFKVYPLSQKDNQPKMNFVNVSGKEINTIHRMDERIYEEINAVVQSEPTAAENPELLGTLAAIGIEKGKPFNPDPRMQAILKEASKLGSAIVRTQMAKPRSEYLYKFKGTQWLNPLAYKSYLFEHNGVRLLDARSAFHFYATGITPAMSMKIIGKGSQYAIAYSDKDGNTFDGSKTYKFHIPANPPMKDFWSFTIYDNQTRSMLQTDQRFPGIDNNKKGLVQNEDGSWDIYIGPKAPKGMENNWIQTVPGKGWNTIFRLYGPLEPWFDGEWYPSDAVLVE
ncbi:DUF1254 domain-containing protein [Flammeovirga yaeyamensis]|uniref:DUF1254 domain-containing protein n=1 Tax=Flammeovirga yaeyamensis TaxID=367791 RepID=A0AAX1N9J0_9BACT|nr:DUF1254 domain-containing protein [Flammeovirga yaeyamensis]MBB3699483.1 hypothetical protein [Flammeovirga yaeyamensis]QWG04120.1 DUF1254 domain-containing protein [Flammeovirga yaeyamensis]